MPEKIGEFSIGDEIARGGMGVVYRGKDEDLKRPVAIKMLPKEAFKSDKERDRFILEAQIVAKLDHPNIMKVYGIRYAKDTVWIVMELLEGVLLSDMIKEKGKLSPQEAGEILDQLSKALSYGHEKGIIHRDIKPGNVMINKEGITKLMDYGIARDEESNLNLTQQGTIMGTPKYMSPEQFTGEKVDLKSDIYSLGIMAFEMITGKAPYLAKNFAGIAYKHIHQPLPPLKKEAKNLPPALEKFILKACAKKKDERLQSLNEVKLSPKDLENTQKLTHYRRALILSFLLLIVISAGGSIWWHLKEKEKIVRSTSLWEQGKIALTKGNGIQAKSFLSEAMSLNPKNEEILSTYQEAEKWVLKEEQRVEAKEHFSKAMEAISLNKLETFQTHLAKAEEKSPEFTQSLQPEIQNALENYRQRMARSHYEKAVQLAAQSEIEKANQQLELALKEHPKYSDAYFLLADNHWEMGNIEGIIENLNKGLKINPNKSANMWKLLSQALSQKKKLKEAGEACEQGLSYFPDSQDLKNLNRTLKELQN